MRNRDITTCNPSQVRYVPIFYYIEITYTFVKTEAGITTWKYHKNYRLCDTLKKSMRLFMVAQDDGRKSR